MNWPNDAFVALSTGAHVSISTIFKHAYVKSSDVVFVAGTLVEGIGNRFSDVDVYVICTQRPKVGELCIANHLRVFTVDHKIVDSRYASRPQNAEHEVLLVHADTECDGVKVDVEFRTYDEVAALIKKIDSVFHYAKHHLLLLTVGVPERDKMFIHRLRVCRVLQGEERYQTLVRQFSFAQYHYLLYRWLASDYSVFLDIVGAGASGEWLRALELARNNVLHQTLAYLNLVGVSNFDPKWLLTYFETAVSLGYFDSSLKDEFYALYGCQGVDTSKPTMVRHYVERTLDFVDAIFLRSRDHIVRNPLLFDLEESNRLIFGATDSEKDGLYSALERDYRGKAYGFPALPSRYLMRAYVMEEQCGEKIKPIC